jgi:uncharacterized protein (DUF1330 family)
MREMPKGYWIVRVDITDQERYQAYLLANIEALSKYGARFRVRGGRAQHPEGAPRERNAVVEFPTYEAALECYRSAEYQRAFLLRQGAAKMDLTVIEGYDDGEASSGSHS